MAPRKLKILPISDKLKLIREVEKGEKSKTIIAKEFGIPKNTLSTILKNKAKIIAALIDGRPVNQYRQKLPQYSDVEERLLKWLQKAREDNIPINGRLIQEKARKIGAELGHEMIASSGWLSNFKKRNNITWEDKFENNDIGLDKKLAEYIEVDCDVPIDSPISNQNNIAKVMLTLGEDNNYNEEDDEETENLGNCPTCQEARKAVETIQLFLENCENVDQDIFTKLNEISSFVSKISERSKRSS